MNKRQRKQIIAAATAHQEAMNAIIGDGMATTVLMEQLKNAAEELRSKSREIDLLNEKCIKKNNKILDLSEAAASTTEGVNPYGAEAKAKRAAQSLPSMPQPANGVSEYDVARITIAEGKVDALRCKIKEQADKIKELEKVVANSKDDAQQIQKMSRINAIIGTLKAETTSNG